MPPRSLHARLVLSLLLILLPVLGGGGFFWFRTETRQLLEKFDARLTSLAAQAQLVLQVASPPASCDRISLLLPHLNDKQGIALYNLDAKRVCQIGATPPPPDFFAATAPQPVQQGVFTTHKRNGTAYRSYISIVQNREQTRQLLVINAGYGPFLRAQRQLAWTLGGLILLILFTSLSLAWLASRLQLRPLDDLSQWIAVLRKTRIAAEPPASLQGALEVEQLQEAVAGLLKDLATDLARARQFSADASHELRTPLTILRGETEVALRLWQDPEETRKVLVSNLEEIDRMSRIIEDLLLLSKCEVGEMPLRFERLDLRAVLEELYLQTRLLGEQKGLKVHFEAPREQVFIQGDPLRLRQLFLNLLTNAVNYTPAAGRITLKLSLLGSLVEVRVADTGIGIAPEDQTQVFDRFFRVDKARNRSDGGSGLGLSIARWVAQSHGGQIKLHSTLGKGSEFIVVLPLSQE